MEEWHVAFLRVFVELLYVGLRAGYGPVIRRVGSVVPVDPRRGLTLGWAFLEVLQHFLLLDVWDPYPMPNVTLVKTVCMCVMCESLYVCVRVCQG